MSKRSRSKKKESRLHERQKKKAARKALYKSYGEAGKSKRSARFKRKQDAEKKRVNPRKVHRNPCGNVACSGCYPEFHARLEARRARHSGSRGSAT